MRQSCHDVGFISNDGKVFGVCLGYDYCAEHEWGIRKISHHFGITNQTKAWYGKPKTLFGLDARKIHKIDKNSLLWYENKKTACLIFVPTLASIYKLDRQRLNKNIDNLVNRELKFRKQNIAAAWDEKSFGVRVRGKKNVDLLRSMYKSILSKDAAFLFMGSQNPFAGNGLSIVQVSNFPRVEACRMRAIDINRKKLEGTAKSVGIEKQLKNANKNWFALTPRWTKDIKNSKQSKYSVMFWLNPMKQHIYKSGWFTVEELRQWCEDKGPVMRKNYEH